MRRCARRDPSAGSDDAGKRADDAITNLSAYALKLDFEYGRLDDRLLELLKGKRQRLTNSAPSCASVTSLGPRAWRFGGRSRRCTTWLGTKPSRRYLINYERRMARPSG